MNNWVTRVQQWLLMVGLLLVLIPTRGFTSSTSVVRHESIMRQDWFSGDLSRTYERELGETGLAVVGLVHTSTPTQGQLVCYDRESFEAVWQRDVFYSINRIVYDASSSLVGISGTGGIVALFAAETGVQCWQRAWEGTITTIVDVRESYLIVGLTAEGYQGPAGLTCLYTTSGLPVWAWYTQSDPYLYAPPAWVENQVFLSTRQRLYCVDAFTGRLHWSTAGLQSNYFAGTPVVEDDLVVVGTDGYKLHSLFGFRRHNGMPLWRVHLGGAVYEPPKVTPMGIVARAELNSAGLTGNPLVAADFLVSRQGQILEGDPFNVYVLLTAIHPGAPSPVVGVDLDIPLTPNGEE